MSSENSERIFTSCVYGVGAQGFNDFIVFSIQAIASLTAGVVLSYTSWKTMNMLCIPFLIIIIFTTLRADRLSRKV